MRKRVALLALVVGAGALAPAAAVRAETPIPAAPEHFVTDRAGFLSTATASELDGRLQAYDRQTGHQLLVYIDHTTGGVPIEDWAVKAFEAWRVGRKGIDDGLVLFVFGDDRRLRIEVGYGLEDRVPDALASRIIRERMVPLIRAGDRDGAVRSGVDALMAAIGGEGAGGGAGQQAPAHIAGWKLVLGAIIALFVLGFLVTHPGLAWLMMMSMGGRGGGGGGWGGGGGGWGGGGGGGGGGCSGGGGRSGGGGASGGW
jgi:uncharacterized protein